MATKKQKIFDPVFTITPAIASNLMRIEAVRLAIQSLPVTPCVLASLRETARLFSTHYSTMIEGNRLAQEQVVQVIGNEQHFPGRERDEGEVKGYYAAFDEVERAARQRETVTDATVRSQGAICTGGVLCARPQGLLRGIDRRPVAQLLHGTCPGGYHGMGLLLH